jgi:deoxyribodipyrimidine photo-lyase
MHILDVIIIKKASSIFNLSMSLIRSIYLMKGIVKMMNPARFQHELQYKKEGLITYIMSDSFRIHFNHGLLRAIELSKETDKGLQIILFRIPEENKRNNDFFKKGIQGYDRFLSKFTNSVYYFEEDSKFFYTLLEKSSHIIKDRAYLKEHRAIENRIYDYLEQNSISFTLVESNVLVPILHASNKEEYSARTIRPKIMKNIEQFIDIKDSNYPVFFYEQEAKEVLNIFLEHKLKNYDKRNDPSTSYTSGLSVYLKYGFISPLEIFQRVQEYENINAELFVEELIVRRELSYNFIYYNKNYDKFRHMTYNWAYETMENHIYDDREYIYYKEDYINFRTHDKYFNAAMKEMVYLGKMHSYMRMYWAKKILEWSPTYEIAYDTIISLNNYYFLDGNTPNGYNGAAWIFGKHDRAWFERLIFGKIRYMNANGLKRKFDIDEYVNKVENIVKNKF